ncbi:hypothetical protein WH50_06450 [Pokkaliibacter plantistimulans]|uniref:Uncharacterized protein n=1 Tax=Pokkaliibacter plantistimulans TaxID=1635171 RepID=A0ABX5M3D1_9GAMM|nr:hypothetical protein [Pokkaliibacter plantistimulans]PXF32091.1 hypothetical protein WH50_06450 [Pokkaliibacter plantistimulans]
MQDLIPLSVMATLYETGAINGAYIVTNGDVWFVIVTMINGDEAYLRHYRKATKKEYSSIDAAIRDIGRIGFKQAVVRLEKKEIA